MRVAMQDPRREAPGRFPCLAASPSFGKEIASIGAMPTPHRRALIEQSTGLSPYALTPRALDRLASLLADLGPAATAETGCGASTLVFSEFSRTHTVFALDEFGVFKRVQEAGLLGPARLEFIAGPTQRTLPQHRFQTPLDAVLLDGPHAYPFPDLEYFHLYPQLRSGGVLVIDDLQIRSVHNLFEFVRRDEMFRLEAIVDRTAFLRRTAVPAFPVDADGWERQGYNQSELLRFTWRERLRRRAPSWLRVGMRRFRMFAP